MLYEVKCPPRKICHAVAFNGNLEALKWLQAAPHSEVNLTKMLVWLKKSSMLEVWDEGTINAAALGGHLSVVKWLREKNDPPCPWSSLTFLKAVRGGNLDMIKYLRGKHKLTNVVLEYLGKSKSPACPVHFDSCTFAASSGDIHILKWLLYNCGTLCDIKQGAFYKAAENGDLGLMIYLHKRRFPIGSQTCSIAARSGHFHVLRWLKTICSWYLFEGSVYASAAYGGKLSVLKWLKSERDTRECLWNPMCCAKAAEAGNFGILKWLREENDPPCPWDANTCAMAAMSGHLDILMWLRVENDPPCPWNVDVCSQACLYGHIHILKWIRESNDLPCPLHLDTCRSLASGKQQVTECLETLITTNTANIYPRNMIPTSK